MLIINGRETAGRAQLEADGRTLILELDEDWAPEPGTEVTVYDGEYTYQERIAGPVSGKRVACTLVAEPGMEDRLAELEEQNAMLLEALLEMSQEVYR